MSITTIILMFKRAALIQFDETHIKIVYDVF